MSDQVKESEILKKLDAMYPGISQIYESGNLQNEQEFKNAVISHIISRSSYENENVFISKDIRELYFEAMNRISRGRFSGADTMIGSTDFTNKWDMIYATTVGPLNKAFQIFFDKKNPAVMIDLEAGGTITAKFSSLQITKANGTMVNLKCIIGECKVADVPYKGEKIGCTVYNIDADIEIELTSAVVTTKENGDIMDVFLDVSNGSHEGSVKINGADRPANVPDFIWNVIMYTINEKLADLLINVLDEPYKLFSINVSADDQKTYDWIIPDVAKFSGANSATMELDDSFIAIYALTVEDKAGDNDNKLKKLSLSINSNIIPDGDTISIGISKPVSMEYVLIPLLYKALEPSLDGDDEEKKADYLTCVKTKDSSDLFVTDAWIESTRNYKFKVEDYNDITMENTKITMVDGGFHFESDFNTEQYWVNVDGSVCFDVSIVKGTDENGNPTLIFKTSKPDIDISTGPSWKLCLVLAAVFLIPIFGMIISGLALLVTELIGKMIDLDVDEFSIPINPPVSYTNLKLKEPADVAISDGVLLSFSLEVSDDTQ